MSNRRRHRKAPKLQAFQDDTARLLAEANRITAALPPVDPEHPNMVGLSTDPGGFQAYAVELREALRTGKMRPDSTVILARPGGQKLATTVECFLQAVEGIES